VAIVAPDACARVADGVRRLWQLVKSGDPGAPLAPFHHIALPQDHTLDAVQCSGPMSDPIYFFTRSKAEPGVADCKAFWSRFAPAAGERQSSQWTSDLRVDGTPEGFFELAMLRAWAEGEPAFQTPVCSVPEAEQVLNGYANGTSKPCSPTKIEETLPNLDLRPRVLVVGDTATVEVPVVSHGCETGKAWGKWASVVLRTVPPYQRFAYTSTEFIVRDCL